MQFELLPAPEKMVAQTGDPKALCCAFECAFACGHTEAARVWIPLGSLTRSHNLEEVVSAGGAELRSRALVNRCRSCTRLLIS